jgi:hypothetical protein
MTSSTQLACSQCGALARPDAEWCSLCLHPLRTPEAEAPLDPLTAPLDQLVGPTDQQTVAPAAEQPEEADHWTSDAVAPQGPMDAPSGPPDPDTVEVMLAMLAADTRSGDPVAPLAGRLSDKGTRVAVTIAGVAVMTVVSLAVLLVVGALT